MTEKPERFEPERAEEIRGAIKEAFVQDDKLRLADIVFEIGPQIPQGEVGIIAQTVRKVNDSHGLTGEYLDLPYVESLVDDGGLEAELGRFREECLDALALEEEGLRPDPEAQALRDIALVSGVDGRNRLGSVMVRDDEGLNRRFDAIKANEGDRPMTEGAFLRLCGWVRYRDLEAY